MCFIPGVGDMVWTMLAATTGALVAATGTAVAAGAELPGAGVSTEVVVSEASRFFISGVVGAIIPGEIVVAMLIDE